MMLKRRIALGLIVLVSIATSEFSGIESASASTIGQMKSGYSGLCMSNGAQTVYTTVTYQVCNTRSASQYWSGTRQLGGVQIRSLHNLCLTVRNDNNNPIAGLALELGTCKPRAISQLFTYSGGGGIPFYLSADKANLKPSAYCVGTATKSVGAHVGLSTCARATYQAWSGPIILL